MLQGGRLCKVKAARCPLGLAVTAPDELAAGEVFRWQGGDGSQIPVK